MSPAVWSGAVARGSQRALATLTDQGVSSLSNFAIGVAVARVAGASGLGGFSLAYAGWLVLAGLHRSMIAEPMAIEGDVAHLPAVRGIRRGLAAEILLGAAGSAVFVVGGLGFLLAGQRAFALGVLALAAWLPALAAQDYWRWVGFMCRHPARSLVNDLVFNGVQGAALAVVFVTHAHSLLLVVACWGAGAGAGAVFGLWQYGVRPSLAGGISLVRDRWAYSKWMTGDALLNTGSNQVRVFIAGAVLGPVGLGGLRAAQALVTGPSMMLIQAGGSIGLPEAAKMYADRGVLGLLRVTRIVTAVGFASVASCAVVIVLWGGPLLSAIYGPGFARYEVAAVVMAVAYVISSFGIGSSLVLKATRNTRELFRVQVVQLAVSVVAVTVLSVLFGVNGAAAATNATVVANVVGSVWLGRRIVRRELLASPGSTVRAAGSPGSRAGTPIGRYLSRRFLLLTTGRASFDPVERTGAPSGAAERAGEPWSFTRQRCSPESTGSGPTGRSRWSS